MLSATHRDGVSGVGHADTAEEEQEGRGDRRARCGL